MKALLLALALPAFAFAASSLLREPGAVYLEDISIKPLRINTTADATVSSKPAEGQFLGTIKKGSIVELIAFTDTAYRVRGQAAQGGVVGWVNPNSLTQLKPEFLDGVKATAKRNAEVAALIAKNEVALNMKPEEVASSLGKAQKKTSKLDAQGRKEVWEFVRYARVPQETTGYDQSGRLVTNTIYVKVPSGKLTVTFENNLVTSLEQSEGNTDVQAPVRQVAVPVLVPY